MGRMMRRSGTTFVKTLPKGSGAIVAMATFEGRLYVASGNGVWLLNSPKKSRFVRCTFQKKVPTGEVVPS